MEFDKSYFNKVKEVKSSLSKSFPEHSALNESFSGGVFRKSAKEYLKDLSIYNLLRGLEIDTDETSYTNIGKMIPSCSSKFSEATSETTFATSIVEEQLRYIQKILNKKEQSLSASNEIIKIIKNSGIDLSTIKSNEKIINSIKNSSTIINEFIQYVSQSVQENTIGLKSTVYSVIDNMDLETLSPESFAASDKRYWLDAEFDAKTSLVTEAPVQRISMMLEMALRVMKIKGISYIPYKNNATEFLKLILTPMSESTNIEIPSEVITELQTVINEVFPKVFSDMLESSSEKWDNVIIPSLQSLFIALSSFLTLKLIVSNIEAVEKFAASETEAKKKTEVTENTKKKFKSILVAGNELKGSDFFNNKKVFYETKKFTKSEQDMIVLLKKFFVSMGLIKNGSDSYIQKPSFDKGILGEAVKKFQSSVKLKGTPLPDDGRIGPNTRLAMSSFIEHLDSVVEESKTSVKTDSVKGSEQTAYSTTDEKVINYYKTK